MSYNIVIVVLMSSNCLSAKGVPSGYGNHHKACSTILLIKIYIMLEDNFKNSACSCLLPITITTLV